MEFRRRGTLEGLGRQLTIPKEQQFLSELVIPTFQTLDFFSFMALMSSFF
jgi:hypothetical protein